MKSKKYKSLILNIYAIVLVKLQVRFYKVKYLLVYFKSVSYFVTKLCSQEKCLVFIFRTLFSYFVYKFNINPIVSMDVYYNIS